MGVTGHKHRTQHMFNFAVDGYIAALNQGAPMFEGEHVNNLRQVLGAIRDDQKIDLNIANVETAGYRKKEVIFDPR